MPSGGTIEVRAENVARPIGLYDLDPWIKISIRDYGSGISAEIMERIFEPYFTTKPAGSGLGLATAYAICTSLSRRKQRTLGVSLARAPGCVNVQFCFGVRYRD